MALFRRNKKKDPIAEAPRPTGGASCDGWYDEAREQRILEVGSELIESMRGAEKDPLSILLCRRMSMWLSLAQTIWRRSMM